MNEKKKSGYWVPFKGCRPLNQGQAKMVGFTLLSGFLAAAIAVPMLGKTIPSGSLVLAVTIVAYFFGKKLFGS